MTPHEQLDLAGNTIPLEELELRGHSLRIARRERELGRRLTADEAGALVHEARGKHLADEICQWCSPDGTAALIALNTRRHQIAERERAEREDPPWTCADCGHENPGGSIFCRGCASTQADDREPHVGAPIEAAEYDPATAPFPEGY